MEEIFSLAEKLGKVMMNHPSFLKLREAEKSVMEDTQTKALIEDFDKTRAELMALERDGKPIEPEQKKKFAEIEEKVKADEKLLALLRAQADYTEMINKVNEKIFSQLSPKKEEK